jgi:hypothetical protein
MTKKQILLGIALAFLTMTGCGSSSHLAGDGGSDAQAPEDGAAEAAPDMPSDTEDSEDAEDSEGEPCCTPPMVLDPFKGICVDPTGYGTSCDGDTDVCAFGQLCTHEWEVDYLGDFCELPCSARSDYLCPEGYVCIPLGCCETAPGEGCIQDVCEPPLRMHSGTGECVSLEGLGEDCSATLTCGPGQTCLEWTVEMIVKHTCVIECAGDGNHCPNGYICLGVADGPPNVCWPSGLERGCIDPGAVKCGRPEKFANGLTRDTICPGCMGAVFCVDPDPEGTGPVEALDPGSHIQCDPLVPEGCPEGLTACLLEFRSGIDDCPGSRPSDFFWSTVCAAAALDIVGDIKCYLNGD